MPFVCGLCPDCNCILKSSNFFYDSISITIEIITLLFVLVKLLAKIYKKLCCRREQKIIIHNLNNTNETTSSNQLPNVNKYNEINKMNLQELYVLRNKLSQKNQY